MIGAGGICSGGVFRLCVTLNIAMARFTLAFSSWAAASRSTARVFRSTVASLEAFNCLTMASYTIVRALYSVSRRWVYVSTSRPAAFRSSICLDS
jgi:hypothetical protein